ALGNPVSGVSVTFVPTGGGVTGGNQITDATGLATVGSWTLGTLAGGNTLTATGAGLTHVFHANGVAGSATALLPIAGNLQSAVVGAAVSTAPAVRAQDQFGNPVPGALITFAVSGGGGGVSGPTQPTNAAGSATVGGWRVTGASAVTDTAGIARVGSWQLGTLVGQNTLTATANGLTGSPVLFTANGTRDVAAQLLRVSIDTQTATAGQAVSTPPAVRV